MTKSARFIRFNFWELNILLLLLALFYANFLGILDMSQITFDIVYFISLFVIQITSATYRKRLHIKSNSALVFVEDERERSIIYKIHSILLCFYTAAAFLLLLAILLINLFTLDIYTALTIIAGWLILMGFLGNIIYYSTWLKYYHK
ncbi:hypothetical protein [Pediococcus pentosaceus]|uniref:hypothetical protein n=1 Tax=Pediococcus pentosaceus TaxID=1255 RepID=UPI0018A17BCB|nr:hypothetical protein [Pediococcus pentosaceus]MBF7137806.1 hypothetical protein [Pediococcus pentosaceus]